MTAIALKELHSRPFWKAVHLKMPVFAAFRRHRALVAALILILTSPVVFSKPAAADFRLCNTTDSRVGVAIGYKNGNDWIATGWWNLTAGQCESLLSGDLSQRYFYVHAVDYDKGGEWSGRAFMCARDRAFIFRAAERCSTSDRDRTGFFEVDTQASVDWTVRLTRSTMNSPDSRDPSSIFPRLDRSPQ